jgi:hypothetical protein
MKPTIYVIGGFSGAGKDTAASVIDAEVVKFASPGKRALEFIYGLEEGFLDDRSLRLEIAPFSGGKTYLEVLIDFWKHRDLLVGEDLFPRQVKATIQSVLDTGRNACITDMRSKAEMVTLTELATYYPLYCIWIEGGKELESDRDQKCLVNALSIFSADNKLHTINNEHCQYSKFLSDVVNLTSRFVIE